jgi:transposase
LILRRGGVSEQSLQQSIGKCQLTEKVELKSLQHKHFKKESEALEAPGQFLRHYSPNIDSYLFSGFKGDRVAQQKVDLS